METIVWWRAGGGRIKKLHGDHCVVERRGGDSVSQEASWRPLSGGEQGEGEV